VEEQILTAEGRVGWIIRIIAHRGKEKKSDCGLQDGFRIRMNRM
jgi:hypothetical protein